MAAGKLELKNARDAFAKTLLSFSSHDLAFSFSQPHSHAGKCWRRQYPQCWVGHHAPNSDSRGPADRGHQPAGGCGLAAVSACDGLLMGIVMNAPRGG